MSSWGTAGIMSFRFTWVLLLHKPQGDTVDAMHTMGSCHKRWTPSLGKPRSFKEAHPTKLIFSTEADIMFTMLVCKKRPALYPGGRYYLHFPKFFAIQTSLKTQNRTKVVTSHVEISQKFFSNTSLFFLHTKSHIYTSSLQGNTLLTGD